jgi:Reverse transcriptase (RNA-dependent DNA polymerase)
VLSNLFYGEICCFSNDVASVIRYCRFHAYADDLQIYHSADLYDMQRCYDEINADLSRIAKWAQKNGLKLNPKKSQVMLIHRLANDLPQPRLVISSDVVKIVSKVVDLGFIFILNSRLTPVDHFSKVCQKIYWVLRSIRPHASCTPIPVRKKLITSLILPHINYSNIVYSHIDSASLRKLGVAYNACLRYIHGLDRRESVANLQCSITGLNLKASATLQQLKFMFKPSQETVFEDGNVNEVSLC